MTTSVIARVSDNIAQDIQFFAHEEQVDRSTEIRRLLALATQHKMIEYALEKYKQRQVTLWKAARLARLPLGEMMRIVAERKIPLQYDVEDLRADFRTVFGNK